MILFCYLSSSEVSVPFDPFCQIHFRLTSIERCFLNLFSFKTDAKIADAFCRSEHLAVEYPACRQTVAFPSGDGTSGFGVGLRAASGPTSVTLPVLSTAADAPTQFMPPSKNLERTWYALPGCVAPNKALFRDRRFVARRACETFICIGT